MKISSKKSIVSAFILLTFSFSSCNKEDITEINSETQSTEAIPNRSARSVSVTLDWDGDPTTLTRAFRTAVNNAGDGGTVIIPNGTYRTDRSIILPRVNNVTIQGSNRQNVRIEATQNFRTAGLMISNGTGTIFRNFTVDWRGLNNASAAISTNGFARNEAYNMRFANAGFGFGVPDNGTGLPIDNLIIDNCQFMNCRVGMIFNRRFNNSQVRSIAQVIIRDCQFLGTQRVGISIDCGNDGADGAEGLRDLPRAREAQGVVTNMNGMLITRCLFQRAELFNIAIAKASNIRIVGNTLEGTTGATNFTENINVEHEANNITINGNTIRNSAQGSSYISLLTFRDYGNAPLFENGVNRIFIANNTFSGNSLNGITGEETDIIRVRNNRFNNPLPTSGRNVNFFRSNRGNRNTIVENNTNTPASRINIVPFQ